MRKTPDDFAKSCNGASWRQKPGCYARRCTHHLRDEVRWTAFHLASSSYPHQQHSQDVWKHVDGLLDSEVRQSRQPEGSVDSHTSRRTNLEAKLNNRLKTIPEQIIRDHSLRGATRMWNILCKLVFQCTMFPMYPRLNLKLPRFRSRDLINRSQGSWNCSFHSPGNSTIYRPLGSVSVSGKTPV